MPRRRRVAEEGAEGVAAEVQAQGGEGAECGGGE